MIAWIVAAVCAVLAVLGWAAAFLSFEDIRYFRDKSAMWCVSSGKWKEKATRYKERLAKIRETLGEKD